MHEESYELFVHKHVAWMLTIYVKIYLIWTFRIVQMLMLMLTVQRVSSMNSKKNIDVRCMPSEIWYTKQCYDEFKDKITIDSLIHQFERVIFFARLFAFDWFLAGEKANAPNFQHSRNKISYEKKAHFSYSFIKWANDVSRKFINPLSHKNHLELKILKHTQKKTNFFT